nr:TPA_asm: ATP8 [Bombus trifasciatus]
MPQMMPINWLMIFIMYLICMFMITMMINSLIMSFKNKNKNKFTYKNWKWMW